MENNQASAPAGDKPSAAEESGQGGSALTGGAQAAAEKVTPVVDGTGGAPDKPKWMEQLPDNLKSDEGLTKFQTVGDLGKSYKELEGRLGKSITIPDDKASEEDRAKYRKALGVPDKPEDYKLDKVEFPKGIEPDEKRTQVILAIAHKHNVPQAAINEIFKTYMTAFAKDIVEAQKIVKITREEAHSQLRNELKGGYDAAMTMKDRAFKHLAGQGEEGVALAKLLDDSGVGNHPLFVKMFSRIGKEIGDHAFVDGGHGTPEAAPAYGHRTDEELAKTFYPKTA